MTGNPEDDTTAETDDIYLAAYYMYAACKFVGKRKVGPKVYFRFQNPAGPISELRRSFFSGEATGRLHDYAQKVIAAKQLLHD
jgi:hypothetical protein